MVAALKRYSGLHVINVINTKKHLLRLVEEDTLENLVVSLDSKEFGEKHVSRLDPELLSDSLGDCYSDGVTPAGTRLPDCCDGVNASGHYVPTDRECARNLKNTISSDSSNSTINIKYGTYSTMGTMVNVLTSTHIMHTEHRTNLRVRISLEDAFNDLIEVILTKGSLYVKPRDLSIYCGVNDHGRITRLGFLLALLARLGLAVKHNGTRPVRYTLKPKGVWLEFVDRCGSLSPKERYRCERGGSLCGLIGMCPYWVIRQTLSKSREGGKQ